MYATQIIKNTNGEDFTMAALVMQVNGFQFQVKVYIALDEGSDYYRIYGEKDGTKKEYHHDIAFDELGDVLDSMRETGGMTKEEYQAKEKTLFVASNIKSFGAKFSVKHEEFKARLSNHQMCLSNIIMTKCFTIIKP